jgi:hypothetical protein
MKPRFIPTTVLTGKKLGAKQKPGKAFHQRDRRTHEAPKRAATAVAGGKGELERAGEWLLFRLLPPATDGI